MKPEAIAPYALKDITLYALRHSSIVRQILRGVPLRVVAALHDTSVTMIERNYSRYIAGQADAIARAALPSFPVIQISAVVPHARPAHDGRCPHEHSYAEFPPYIAKSGSMICVAECARLRTRRNKAAKRVSPASDLSATGTTQHGEDDGLLHIGRRLPYRHSRLTGSQGGESSEPLAPGQVVPVPTILPHHQRR